MKLVFAPLVVLFAVLPAYWVFRRVSALGHASRRFASLALVFGAAVALVAALIERAVLSFTVLSFEARVSGTASALLASFLLAAPLEEALKTLVVWPLYRMRRIDGPRLGLCYALAAAAGFAAALGLVRLLSAPFDWVLTLRVLCQVPPQLFFAGLWGYVLGARRGQSGRAPPKGADPEHPSDNRPSSRADRFPQYCRPASRCRPEFRKRHTPCTAH